MNEDVKLTNNKDLNVKSEKAEVVIYTMPDIMESLRKFKIFKDEEGNIEIARPEIMVVEPKKSRDIKDSLEEPGDTFDVTAGVEYVADGTIKKADIDNEKMIGNAGEENETSEQREARIKANNQVDIGLEANPVDDKEYK